VLKSRKGEEQHCGRMANAARLQMAVAIHMNLIEVDTESAGNGLAKKRKGHCTKLNTARVKEAPKHDKLYATGKPLAIVGIILRV
jgi:hypothetical protein